MTIEIPDIPRDRPLVIFSIKYFEPADSMHSYYYWAPKHREAFRFTLGPWEIEIIDYGSGEYSSEEDAWDADMVWSFDHRKQQIYLRPDEAKALGLPKLETRRNGDKLEVWAVDWE